MPKRERHKAHPVAAAVRARPFGPPEAKFRWTAATRRKAVSSMPITGSKATIINNKSRLEIKVKEERALRRSLFFFSSHALVPCFILIKSADACRSQDFFASHGKRGVD